MPNTQPPDPSLEAFEAGLEHIFGHCKSYDGHNCQFDSVLHEDDDAIRNAQIEAIMQQARELVAGARREAFEYSVLPCDKCGLDKKMATRTYHKSGGHAGYVCHDCWEENKELNPTKKGQA